MLAVKATAPRIRQNEHEHRRAEANPSGKVNLSVTAPQWQAAFRVSAGIWVPFHDVSTTMRAAPQQSKRNDDENPLGPDCFCYPAPN